MLVEDIMSTSLKTVKPDTPMSEVVSMMCLYRLSGIPVVEEDNRLVGFISERDVLNPMFPTLEDMMDSMATIDMTDALGTYSDIVGMKVNELMTKSVISVSPKTEILKASARMIGNRFRRIPVAVDGKLVGMLSVGDVHKSIYLRHVKDRIS
ncbi:MAG: CBS domain-containing protein [Pseudomonadota bacterium]